MQTRKDYEHALDVIGQVVRSWDPYALLADGAPADEFDAEIALLVAHVPSIHSGDDAAHAISAVFSQAFEPELFTSVVCAEPGALLFAKLEQAGLVSGPNNSFKPNPLRGSA